MINWRQTVVGAVLIIFPVVTTAASKNGAASSENSSQDVPSRATGSDSEADDSADSAASPVHLELRLEPTSDSWSRLWLEVRNATETPLVGWAFEVLLDGAPVDGYQDLLMLKPVEPGGQEILELYRLETPLEPFKVSVSVIEAWVGEAAPEASNDAWRVLSPVAGLPVVAAFRSEAEP